MTRACLLTLLALMAGLHPAEAADLEVLSPRGEVWLQPGEILEVSVRGRPGEPVRLHHSGGQATLEEVEPGTFRGALAARFQGEVRVSQGGRTVPLSPVKVLEAHLPVLEVTKSEAIYRSGPDSAYDRYDPLPAGYRSLVSGRRGDWLRLEPAGGWVELAHGRLLEPGAAPSRPVLRGGRVAEPGDGSAEVTLRLGDPAPWQVIEELETGRIVLWLPGAAEAMGEVMYPEVPERIRSVRLEPSGQGTRVVLALGPEGLWGYNLRWRAPDLVLRLAPPPRRGWRNPPAPGPAAPDPTVFQGLRVALDPGHGGPGDPGAVGRDGMKEAEANLRVSRALKGLLEARGATVTLTRDSDRSIAGEEAGAEEELGGRVRLAEEAGAHLFLSLHHNARPTVEEGRVAHGTHIYYYRPQSRDLAGALAAPLAAAQGEPDHAALWRSFHVIRQTGMPAVLVEVNFLSNPEIERAMGAPDYADRVARGLVEGLENFLVGARKDG